MRCRARDELVDLDVLLALHHRDVVLQLDLCRPRRCLTPALPDHVVRDRDQPCGGVPRILAALERAQRVHEGRLGDVLRIRVVAEHRVRVAVHLADVVAIEVVQRRRGAGAGLSGCHDPRSRSGILAARASPLQSPYI